MTFQLSIITVNLNNREGLKRTIASIRSQQSFRFEYIIIDGGSTDGSVDVIRDNQDIITHWVSEKDTGVYNAMNKGIKCATGEYCYFLNSGDTLAQEHALKEVFAPPVIGDIIYGNMIHGGKETVEHGQRELSFFDFYSGSIYHQSAFIRRSLFDTVGLYNESFRVVSDWEFFVKAIFLHHCSTRWVNVTVARYETGGISFQNPERNFRERQAVLERFFPGFLKDYSELNRYKKSDLAGVHKALEDKAVFRVPIQKGLQLSRFIRFRVLKKKY